MNIAKNTQIHTEKTKILNFDDPAIEALISRSGWEQLNDFDKIGAVYNFVKDDIKFGYNASDNLSAGQVLKDGYGQCNTKSTLLMALLRRLGIPNRFHGFTIDNALQKGAIPTYLFGFAPKHIIHSWVEVFYDNRWINLEGFILDDSYLSAIQTKFSNVEGSFSGYGIATKCLTNPPVQWTGTDTYIQKEGISQDFGVYDNPDAFYEEKGTNLSGVKRLLFKFVLRHLMNVNVQKIRKPKKLPTPATA